MNQLSQEGRTVDVRSLIKAYIKLREARSTLKAEYEAKDEKLKEQMEKIQNALMSVIKETGSDSVKSAGVGVASRVKQVRVWAPDRDEFIEFVKEHDAFDLLENRIHQTNVKQFMEQHPDLPIPVNVDAKYIIKVTKAK